MVILIFTLSGQGSGEVVNRGHPVVMCIYGCNGVSSTDFKVVQDRLQLSDGSLEELHLHVAARKTVSVSTCCIPLGVMVHSVTMAMEVSPARLTERLELAIVLAFLPKVTPRISEGHHRHRTVSCWMSERSQRPVFVAIRVVESRVPECWVLFGGWGCWGVLVVWWCCLAVVQPDPQQATAIRRFSLGTMPVAKLKSALCGFAAATVVAASLQLQSLC